MKGYSLIEILLYVAILSLIAIVLANYLLASLSGQSEHSARDDIQQVQEDIQAALSVDIASAVSIVLPVANATSTSFILKNSTGTTTWSASGNTLTRVSPTETRVFGGSIVKISETLFTNRSTQNIRLNSTTTSIEYHFDFTQNKENIKRAIDGFGVAGMQGL